MAPGDLASPDAWVEVPKDFRFAPKSSLPPGALSIPRDIGPRHGKGVPNEEVLEGSSFHRQELEVHRQDRGRRRRFGPQASMS